jgi:uncharacterized membrane protein
MDPHEQLLHYQALLEERKLKVRLIAAFDKIRRHMQLQDVSPSRSSRIAAYVRTHKGALVGGTVTAVVIALCSEVIRRANGKS